MRKLDSTYCTYRATAEPRIIIETVSAETDTHMPVVAVDT